MRYSRYNSCNGVSAVVGVMVMLTLLVIISALLSAYAGGLAKVPEHVPSAELAVYTAGSGQDFSIVFEHRNGDPLSTEDCQVVAFVDDNEGIFMLSDIHQGKFSAGSKITTTSLAGTAELLGITPEELAGYIATRTPVEIAVYDLPSGSPLYRSTIILEEKE